MIKYIMITLMLAACSIPPAYKAIDSTWSIDYQAEVPGQDVHKACDKTKKDGFGDCEDFARCHADYLKEPVTYGFIKSEVSGICTGHAWVEHDGYIVDNKKAVKIGGVNLNNQEILPEDRMNIDGSINYRVHYVDELYFTDKAECESYVTRSIR